VWQLIEVAYESRGQVAIIPLQDLLGMDASARMNTPGTVEDNWQWRYLSNQITPELGERLIRLGKKYGRGGQ
jgi:4-alpha-glucanotransferase